MKKILFSSCVMLTIIFFLSSCGASSSNIEDSSISESSVKEQSNEKYITDMNFSNDNDFWEYAESAYGITSFEDIRSRKKKMTTVVVDALFLGYAKEDKNSYTYTLGYLMDDNSYTCYQTSVDHSPSSLMTDKNILSTLKQGDTIRICARIINSDYLDLKYIYGLKVTGYDYEGVQAALNLSDNPLLDLEIGTDYVKSGSGNIIGTRAYIRIDKEDILSISDGEYYEFAKNIVEDSNYNWFTIFLNDGTAINFESCYIYYASYGKCNYDGTIQEVEGNIQLSFDGKTVKYIRSK